MWRNIGVKVGVLIWGLMVFASDSNVFAASCNSWYECYLSAVQAAESKDWTNAIALLDDAIKKEAQSEKGKKAYGMRRIDYYPYLELGKAYLGKGDAAAARQACEHAQKEGIAPKSEVDACLNRAGATAPAPAPTLPPVAPPPATPTPLPAIPKPLPAQPQPGIDAKPSINIISALPPETENDSFEIKGIAADDRGITNLQITVKTQDKRDVPKAVPFVTEFQQFKADVPLAVGKNVITVAATDTAGQTEKKEFVLVRKAVMIVKMIVTVSPPPPAPQPPTPRPQPADAPPAITLLEEIPAKSESDTLSIQGFADDARGIREVKVSVKKAGSKSAATISAQNRSKGNPNRFVFKEDVPLNAGANEIAIEAITAKGQITKQAFKVDYKVSATPTPTPQPETAPIITLAAIPAEVEQEMFELRAVVEDEHGIKAVDVNKVGTRGVSVAMLPEKKPQGEKKYELTRQIPLTPGPNDVTIVATDVNGQETRQTLRIFRKIPPQKREGDVWAVIIGIGQYQDSRLNLRFTENDAQGLYDVLTNPDFGDFPKEHVKLLLNQEATAKNIKSAIGRWLSQQAGPNDTVIIYYAGHGAPEGNETYWVTYDADINDLFSSALNNNVVADMLSRIQAKRLITLLDACYSAATVSRTNSTRATPIEIPWDKFTGAGRVTIAASNGKQQSLEDEQLKHGVFTYHLIAGLQGKADGQGGQARDGVVDLDEMWNYVKDRVKDDARKLGNEQEPVIKGEHSSGILLAYDGAFFRQQDQQQKTMVQEQSQDIKNKQAKLQKLYDQDQISAELLDCALKMLKTGASNKYLEALLADKMSAETFALGFKCSAPK